MFAHSRNGREEHSPTAIDARQRSQGQVAELPEARSPERQPLADRVAYLFPRPETTEWNVSELSYDRRRRAGSHPERRAS